ncbi:MAG TPA: hypothetical protein PLT25_04955 [Acidocella sp.]|nr:hypothetical protein [Acidocella sp.]
MLDIETFDNLRGGNVVYKALAHPVAAEALARLVDSLNESGMTAIYDPDGIAGPLLALSPTIDVAGIYVHDSLAVGQVRGGHIARALLELPSSGAAHVLIAAFDAGRLTARITPFLPPGAQVITLDPIKLPANLVTNPSRYLDPVNFATNFVFFRDDDHFATRLTTVNYWAGYGAKEVKFFHRLFSQTGTVLAEWEIPAPPKAGGFVIDSREVRARFGLAAFTGQLFIHAVGVAGHDVVKYALDTYATNNSASLSCTHDANAWPSERFAGLPAPLADERVVLWVQNSHAVTIPSGALSLDRMGNEKPVPIDLEIPAFATHPVDVADYFPALHWPAQIELRAGRHLVRPRYEVTRQGRSRIAHINVERSDLKPDPGIKTLSPALGRGFLLPFPILPRQAYKTIVQPTPMAVSEMNMPLRIDVFDPEGKKILEHYLGVLPRNHDIAVDMDELLATDLLPSGGHAELVYDFRDGGDANGWLHALFRFEDRVSGHAAESSFGAHMFNTIMTYKSEPQSYNGPPPGLSTRLFLKMGLGGWDSFCTLIYPASAAWHPKSTTMLELHDTDGVILETKTINIACSGSMAVYPTAHFSAANIKAAGEAGYVLIRDVTCRLFGFHGVTDGAGSFSLDHMFGF